MALTARALFLVLAICYILNVWIPAGSAIFTGVVLIWSGARPAACHHRGCMRPGFCSGLVNHRHREPDHQVIWCIFFRYGLTHASRVGIQCLTSGVRLATLKILARCFRSCTSPESCHLKYFDFLDCSR
jgi:hypothetical protein